MRDSDDSKKKMKELERTISNLGSYIEANIKKSTISKFADYFTANATKFIDFKEPYRLVVGHVFSKAHRAIS
jgi:hypothetical protein